MGHTEMALAVAGLDRKRIDERIGMLASGSWQSFSFPERAAFQFVHKLARTPAAVNAGDLQELVYYFGPERALDVIWWGCRCHYMTCVSDAFQLPLEEQNVFDGFLPESHTSKP
jgi:hypothetical protein